MTETNQPRESAPEENVPTEEVEVTIEGLQAKLAETEQQSEQYLNLAKQKQADFENYQKRIQRDIAQERRFAASGLARDLLSALDNLERATAAAKQAGEEGPLVDGVAMVYSQFLDILKGHGVVQMSPVGEPFDPNEHEAISQIPTDEHPPSTVVEVFEAGYRIHDRVLRPPKVVISVAPVEAKTEE